VNYKPVKDQINKEITQKLKDLKEGKITPVLASPEKPGVLSIDNVARLGRVPRSRSTMSQRSIVTNQSIQSSIKT
jgi:hypothetical protein